MGQFHSKSPFIHSQICLITTTYICRILPTQQFWTLPFISIEGFLLSVRKINAEFFLQGSYTVFFLCNKVPCLESYNDLCCFLPRNVISVFHSIQSYLVYFFFINWCIFENIDHGIFYLFLNYSFTCLVHAGRPSANIIVWTNKLISDSLHRLHIQIRERY